ncbi:MAG: non-lysosomal glucosylceramidase [Candidatus Abyssubacteria bacterium]
MNSGGAAPFVYSGKKLTAFAFPLGGIGTGHVVMGGDGGLRQWQIFNNVNHSAHVPYSFFALHVEGIDAKPVVRLLQSKVADVEEHEAAPSVSDHLTPWASTLLMETLPCVESISFTGRYPVIEATYRIPRCPAEVSLRAYSPFIPLDADDSGIPVIVFHFDVANTTDRRMAASLLMSQQNAVGWDESSDIDGVKHPSFGGNRNRIMRESGLTAVEMTNASLQTDHPRCGQMLIAVLDESATVRGCWTDLKLLWADFEDDGLLSPMTSARPSRAGQTINAAIASRVAIEPRQRKRVTFLLAWYFPNRYVDWEQPTLQYEEDLRRSRFWLGNYYASRFGSAFDAAKYVSLHLDRFDAASDKFLKAMYDTSLPVPLVDAAASQIAVIRSPTCFRSYDGRFYGFEGCHGASTEYQGTRGGCCPLNCTHVWNYAMTVSRLYPMLERSMREIEWFHQQHETGYLPHRVVVPLSLTRPWGKWIGGPPYPALDGLLGAVLKSYREFRNCGNTSWLTSIWEHVRLALEHVIERYDRGDGVIHGPQPCTYDVEIEGPNSFIESLYLASLRAAEQMAKAVGDVQASRRYRDIFGAARRRADRLLWNGEYYIHRYDPETEASQAYGRGCHSDQLFGQWWAHSLGFGHVLPRAHVRRALGSIVKHNFRENLEGHQQFPRRYLRDDESGLLNCTWPKGGRPDTPLLYSDEVWTGIEYEVAALLLFEGMLTDALKIVSAVRTRHDGRLRSPWNEVECGDHYVRAMSSWMLLEAAAGYEYDASKAIIGFSPRFSPHNFKSFFASSNGWGRYSQRIVKGRMTATLSVYHGAVSMREMRLSKEHASEISARTDTETLEVSAKTNRGRVAVKFRRMLELREGQSLEVSVI